MQLYLKDDRDISTVSPVRIQWCIQQWFLDPPDGWGSKVSTIHVNLGCLIAVVAVFVEVYIAKHYSAVHMLYLKCKVSPYPQSALWVSVSSTLGITTNP